MRTSDWIDGNGFFIFGKHKGETIEYVTRHDPGYVQWIIDNVENISDGDRHILQTLLDRG